MSKKKTTSDENPDLIDRIFPWIFGVGGFVGSKLVEKKIEKIKQEKEITQ